MTQYIYPQNLKATAKGTTAEAELERALDVLYGKTVPAGVREFIDMRSGNTSPAAVPKPRKPRPTPSAVGVPSASGGDSD